MTTADAAPPTAPAVGGPAVAGGPSTARLADIAAQASVSEATVSRVLNGRTGVASATRQKVLAALDVLGYERPVRLRQRSAGLIGLVIPELTNPIFPAFAQVIEQALSGYGYTPVLGTHMPGGATEDELVDQLVERGVTGIIFLSGLHADVTADPARYDRLSGQGVPFVLVNGYNERISAPFVSPDDRAAARIAVRHLADLGHRRIGLAVGPSRFVPARRKAEGFAAALEETGVSGVIQHTLFTVEGGHAAGGALLDQGCTGIVCGSDLMALGAVRAARGRGLDVPGDLSVVGYDDSELIAFTDPPLTTVRQPVRAMAHAAVQSLLEEIGGNPVPRAEFVFQPELVVRGSTAQPRPA
ncbi:LacI family DNA-binding transcriptional regulator [Streptomyces sp. OF3]|uniref:LacI family DNA-binding transcriptional regulator n=1 Tax=Streptomyces alkaliterrae TaxID=2213162 RepID=A0A5P0YPA2_9ACTN|nr:LacI family DNA-binding transcriptional regulator [Streptomyces alkaliterrae]MBB1260415.1 LacI family DNA-binding transcriptional regulator [Streptomyces alkaliterrae]MQS02146.1 LacI family DNA-binding transcriptional regulator [Streptomyces alkaliterrae]